MFESHSLTMVPVIASFDTEGTITPLYIRIENVAYKIIFCHEKMQTYPQIKEYICKINNNGVLSQLILMYHCRENIWGMKPVI